MSLITLLILHLGVGSTLAWLRHHEGVGPAATAWTLFAWPLEFVLQCLAVLHEATPVSQSETG